MQSAGATVLRPFAVGFERVAQPFRDAYGWADSLLTRAPRPSELRAENRDLRQRAIQSEFALQENEYLRRLLDYLDGPRFPTDFDPVAAEVIGRPGRRVHAGDRRRRRLEQRRPRQRPGRHRRRPRRARHPGDPGTARVQLLTDEEAAVVRGRPPDRRAGIVRHARGTRETLVLDRVRKQDVVRRGDEIVTAGWRASEPQLALSRRESRSGR